MVVFITTLTNGLSKLILGLNFVVNFVTIVLIGSIGISKVLILGLGIVFNIGFKGIIAPLNNKNVPANPPIVCTGCN